MSDHQKSSVRTRTQGTSKVPLSALFTCIILFSVLYFPQHTFVILVGASVDDTVVYFYHSIWFLAFRGNGCATQQCAMIFLSPHTSLVTIQINVWHWKTYHSKLKYVWYYEYCWGKYGGGSRRYLRKHFGDFPWSYVDFYYSFYLNDLFFGVVL